MDQSVNPCDNFVQFACGNYQKNTVVDEFDAKKVQTIDELFKIVDNVIYHLLTKKDTENLRYYQLAQKYYSSCRKRKTLSKVIQPVIIELDNIARWPILEGDTWANQFDWIDVVYKLKQNGFQTNFFHSEKFDVFTEIAHPFRNRRNVAESNKNVLDTYMAIAKYMAPHKKSFDAEIQDYKHFLSEVKKLDHEEKPLGTKVSISKWPNISKYISRIIEPNATKVLDSKYLDSLERLIKKTDNKTKANYIFWNVVDQVASLMNYKRQHCLVQVQEKFDVAISSLYAKYATDPEKILSARELVKNLKMALKSSLNSNKWLDPVTKEKAIEKLDALFSYVGHSPEMMNETVIEDYYKDLNYDSNFVQFNFNVHMFKNKQTSEITQTIRNRTSWLTYLKTFDVNAYYSVLGNIIYIPTGIQEGMAFSKDRPNYLNYGALGTIVGHEMTHAFDLQGASFDKNGQKNNWWKEETRKKFIDRVGCVMDKVAKCKYVDYDDNGNNTKETHFKANNTISEDIADLGGVKNAYIAYNLWAKDKPLEPALPGLTKFTQKQLFWISYGNFWCQKITKREINRTVCKYVHSMNYLRIINPLRNIEGFSRDFNCPAGSWMNPKEKCDVW